MPSMDTPLDMMKAISMFDTEADFDNTEAREKLDILFHNLIMSDDPDAKEFLERFLNQAGDVISDMGVIEKKPEEEPEDEVEMPTDDEVDAGEEAPEEEIPVDEPTDEEPVENEGGDEEEAPDEVTDDLLGASYNPLHENAGLVSRANSFLNY